jgi:protein involved in polysaccharide export with SLBB domain
MRRLPLVWLIVALAPAGCASVTNPLATAGIPVHRLPPELLAESKEALQPLPLAMLRQKPQDDYRLAARDVLGIWIEGVLGDRNQAPPVQAADREGQPPALGYPIPVREDGTITLPYVAPVKVAGRTLAEAEQAIREAYVVRRQILQPGQERILVTLARARRSSVLVIREDAGGVAVTPNGLFTASKRGTGQVVELPAGENDVLTALARTGGLPGLEAKNEILIQRGAWDPDRDGPPSDFARWRPDPRTDAVAVPASGAGAITCLRIPLRTRPGQPPRFRPEDVILQNGDIVLIEARDTEVFYTGGLLGSREVLLPRDRDLDVVQAIAFVGGPLANGAFNQNNLAGNIQATGIGAPSPSNLVVVRRTPDGGQVPIYVDLNRALVDARERILVQPGDLLILQNTLGEALAQYVSTVFRVGSAFTLLRERDATSAATLNVP